LGEKELPLLIVKIFDMNRNTPYAELNLSTRRTNSV